VIRSTTMMLFPSNQVKEFLIQGWAIPTYVGRKNEQV
jgi:hypothetical protein